MYMHKNLYSDVGEGSIYSFKHEANSNDYLLVER